MADQEIFNSSRNLHFGRNCAVEAASRSSDLESQSSAGLLNFDAEIENLKDGQIVVQHEAGIEIISPPSEIITVGELEQMKEEFESLIGFIPATVVQYLNKHLVEDTQKHSRPPIIHT